MGFQVIMYIFGIQLGVSVFLLVYCQFEVGVFLFEIEMEKVFEVVGVCMFCGMVVVCGFGW